jgi:hypothetical protein
LLRRVENLSRRINKTPTQIVDEVIELYELSFSDLPAAERDKRLLTSPLSMKIFSDRLSLLNKQAAGKITKKELQKRASAGGAGRATSLSKRRRQDIAKKAAETRWKPK